MPLSSIKSLLSINTNGKPPISVLGSYSLEGRLSQSPPQKRPGYLRSLSVSLAEYKLNETEISPSIVFLQDSLQGVVPSDAASGVVAFEPLSEASQNLPAHPASAPASYSSDRWIPKTSRPLSDSSFASSIASVTETSSPLKSSFCTTPTSRSSTFFTAPSSPFPSPDLRHHPYSGQSPTEDNKHIPIRRSSVTSAQPTSPIQDDESFIWGWPSSENLEPTSPIPSMIESKAPSIYVPSLPSSDAIPAYANGEGIRFKHVSRRVVVVRNVPAAFADNAQVAEICSA